MAKHMPKCTFLFALNILYFTHFVVTFLENFMALLRRVLKSIAFAADFFWTSPQIPCFYCTHFDCVYNSAVCD